MNKYSFVILLLFSLLLIGCSSEKTPEQKAYSYPPKPTQEVSYIHLPISLPLSELEAIVNRRVNTTLLTKTNIEAEKVTINKLEVYRTDDVSLSGVGNKLQWEVPIRFKVLATPNQKLLQLNFLKELAVNFSLTFILQSQLSLTEDYHLHTKTELTNYQWSKEPELSFGKLHFSLTKPLAKQIALHKDELTHRLDSLIAKKVNLKPTVEKIWSNLHAPKSLEKEFHLFWLLIEPQEITTGPIVVHRKEAEIPIRLAANLALAVEEKAPQIPIKPMPNLQRSEKLEDDFELNLFSEISYDKLNELWPLVLQERTFQVQGEELNLDSLTFFGMGDKLGVQVWVSGFTNATVTFSGKPIIRKEDFFLSFQDFDYVMEEGDLLASGAEWVYGAEFKELVANMLNVSLRGPIMMLPLTIEEGLNKGEKGDRRTFGLKEMEIIPESPLVHQEALFLEVKAVGKADLNINQLKKKKTLP